VVKEVASSFYTNQVTQTNFAPFAVLEALTLQTLWSAKTVNENFLTLRGRLVKR